MSDFNLFTSALVLAIVLPVSVSVLYAMMASHTPLSPTAEMDHAALMLFDSEEARAEYHASHQAQQHARCMAVASRYRAEMERQMRHGMDPRAADPYRKALAATDVGGSVGRQDEVEPLPADASPPMALARAAAPEPRVRRPRGSLWRAHRSAPNQ